MDDTYSLRRRPPTAPELARLRDRNRMAERSMAGLGRGLPNSTFGVVVVDDSTDRVVGTGRIVGDDGSVYQICDMVVHPDHHGRGFGFPTMDALTTYVEETAPPSAYVNLLADVVGFYERWGLEPTALGSRGMVRRTD